MQIRKFRFHSLSTVLAAALLAGGFSAAGQDLYKLKFKGTRGSLDGAGNAQEERLDNKTLIREWAARAGVTDVSGLQLVFHRNADANGGDAIEVVDRDGSVVVTAFPMTFPEPAKASAKKGIIESRFAYVYNLYHSEFSRGTVIMNRVTTLDKQGGLKRFAVKGEMQWYEVPEGTNGLRICAGTFKAGKPFRR